MEIPPGPDNGQTEIKPVRTPACLDCTQPALGCLFHQYIPQHDKITPAFHPFVIHLSSICANVQHRAGLIQQLQNSIRVKMGIFSIMP